MFRTWLFVSASAVLAAGQLIDQLFPTVNKATRQFSKEIFKRPVFKETTKVSTDLFTAISHVITVLPIALSGYIPTPILPSSDTNIGFTDSFIAEYKFGLTNEDVALTVDELIGKYGYPLEEHQVVTDDGYLLTMFRIPNEGPPVFLMHGLTGSADDFVIAGPESGLAYLLFQEGYDVWMGNARGNKHSRSHINLHASDAAFWDFSWHEIGCYDLPTMIDHVLNETSNEKLTYIGHSQGTTSFFVMGSERPEYNEKISLMVALSPVAYMTNAKSPILRLLAPAGEILHAVVKSVGAFEFFPSTPLSRSIRRVLCGNSAVAEILCSNLMFVLGGFSFDHLNVTNLPVIYGHLPSGSSAKQFLHYGQGVLSSEFRYFDYGARNLDVYGEDVPPSYVIENIKAPVSLWYSRDDWLAHPSDVRRLSNRLPNVADDYEIPDDTFNHFDFLFAKDFRTIIYKRLRRVLEM